MLTNPRDAFRGQSRSPNIVPFHILGIVSSCAIVNLSLRRAVFSDIRLQKCRDLENRVRGPSRSLEISPFDRAHTTSCSRSIVTMALSRDASEIFNVEKCRDLEIGVKGHSKSLNVGRRDESKMYNHCSIQYIIYHTWCTEKFGIKD